MPFRGFFFETVFEILYSFFFYFFLEDTKASESFCQPSLSFADELDAPCTIMYYTYMIHLPILINICSVPEYKK